MPLAARRRPIPTMSGYSDEMFFRSTMNPRELSAGQLLSEDSYNTCYYFVAPTTTSVIEIDIRGMALTIIGDELPGWLTPVASDIERIARLPENWNSYRALRLEHESVLHGLQLLLSVMPDKAGAPSVHPTAHGGIQFEWNTPSMVIEVEVTSEGKAVALVENLSTGKEWEADVTKDSGRLREAISLA